MLDILPAPVEGFAMANPVLVHNAIVIGGVLVIAGATVWGLRKLGALS